MAEDKQQEIANLLAAFREATLQIIVDEDLGLHVFLVQPATAEQTLRLEVDADWLDRHETKTIRDKLKHFDVIEKLRTCGGVPVRIDGTTCP